MYDDMGEMTHLYTSSWLSLFFYDTFFFLILCSQMYDVLDKKISSFFELISFLNVIYLRTEVVIN